MVVLESSKIAITKITEQDLKLPAQYVAKLRRQQELINALVRDMKKLNTALDLLTFTEE